jgi:hypothetical protein
MGSILLFYNDVSLNTFKSLYDKTYYKRNKRRASAIRLRLFRKFFRFLDGNGRPNAAEERWINGRINLE